MYKKQSMQTGAATVLQASLRAGRNFNAIWTRVHAADWQINVSSSYFLSRVYVFRLFFTNIKDKLCMCVFKYFVFQFIRLRDGFSWRVLGRTSTRLDGIKFRCRILWSFNPLLQWGTESWMEFPCLSVISDRNST